MTTKGHNSYGITGDQLKSYIERVEKLEEEKSNLQADIREVYSEAKASGFDTKVLRKVVAWRKKDRQDRSEEMELFRIYLRAIGDDILD